jgi:hypothetical protein
MQHRVVQGHEGNKSDLFWRLHCENTHHSTLDHPHGLLLNTGKFGDHASSALQTRLSLEQQLAALEQVYDLLKEKKKVVDAHISALHGYNEAKDVAQMLLGQLAEQEGCRTSDLYPRYGLELTD